MVRILFLMVFLGVSVVTGFPKDKSDAEQVAAMLNDWYDAADKGDGARYFSHFVCDAVFMGTDPGERWSVSELRARFQEVFDGHRAWKYESTERHVLISDDAKIGWFDEKLKRTPDLGPMRATGVVIKVQGLWKIQHYSLTFLVPNEVVETPAEQSNCRPQWSMQCVEPKH